MKKKKRPILTGFDQETGTGLPSVLGQFPFSKPWSREEMAPMPFKRNGTGSESIDIKVYMNEIYKTNDKKLLFACIATLRVNSS